MPEDIEIPLDKLDELWGEDTDQSPEPAAETDEPEEEVDETDSEDTEEEDAGDEEPVDESDDTDEEGRDAETEEESEEDDSEPAEDDFLSGSKFDRKAIENHKDPEVKKILTAAYKSMQGAFTKAMQGAQTKVKSAEKLVSQAEQVIENHERFVKTLSDDKGAERFLIQVALKRPEVFQKAFDAAAKMHEDPTEKERFESDQRREQDAAEVNREKQRIAAEKQQRKTRVISRETERLAKENGVSLKVARAYVVNRIHERDGKVTKRDVREAVKQAAEDLEAERQKAVRKVTKERTTRAQEAVRARAKGKKRPPAPGASPRPAGAKPSKAPKGTDGIDHAIDHFFGLND